MEVYGAGQNTGVILEDWEFKINKGHLFATDLLHKYIYPPGLKSLIKSNITLYNNEGIIKLTSYRLTSSMRTSMATSNEDETFAQT